MTATPEPVPAKTLNRALYIDVLKIVGISMVILNHCCDVLREHAVTGFDWWYSFAITVITIPSVPGFVMCSGALLLNSKRPIDSLRDFYLKRLPKLVVPLLVWSVVYYVFPRGPQNLTWADLPRFAEDFMSGKIVSHLWFMYMIIGLYIALPFLKLIYDNAQKAHILVFFALCVLFGQPFLLLQYLLKVNPHLYDMPFGTYMGYFMLGGYLHRYKPSFRGLRATSLFMLFGVGAFTLYICHVLKQATDLPPLLITGYSTWTMTAMSVGLFLFIQSFSWKSLEKHAGLLSTWSNAVYGIYLSHLVFRALLRNGDLGFKLTSYTGGQVVGVLVSTLAMFFLSLALTLILQRIPYVRNTVS